jgi:hypothetical protein
LDTGIERRSRADILVLIDHDVTLARRHRYGHDLILEAAGFLGRFGLVLGSDRELILLLAADLPFLRNVLRRRAHVISVKCVPQAVLDHGVDKFHVAHLGARTHVGHMR